MPVRKTESRLPPNFQAADFGEAVVAPDGRCALVSFITSPLAVNRENVYVVFVTDAALAGTAQSFEWIFTESGGASTTQSTEHGEFSYSPQSTGGLDVVVRILGAGNAEQAKLEMVQDVGPPNAELESLITSAGNGPGPGVSNPDVARELINDHNPYYQTVTLQTPEAGDGFQRFVFGMAFYGALLRTAAQRKPHIDKLAESLNSQASDFATLAAQALGVCAIRLPLLAMTLQQAPGNPTPLLNWTELPELSPKRDFADEQLRKGLAALEEAARIDLFNLARFPKSNITRCGRILEAVRGRYFGGTNFNDALTGMSGTRAYWIVRHYRVGPLLNPKATGAILPLLGIAERFRPIKKPAPLPPIVSLQKILTEAYNAEKANLEPSTMAIGGFTLKNKKAAISIIMIDDDGNNHYAEINGTRMDYSGSLVKAAALYAAFDLRSAARQHAKDNSFSDKPSFFTSFTAAIDTSTAIQQLKNFHTGHKPDLNKIFEGFKATAPNKVEFTANFQTHLDNIIDSPHAGNVIRALGYSYINVSMIRGKFFDPDPAKLNGIWLAGDYSEETILPSERIPVENDTVAGGSGQAITTKEMSRMFYLVHTGKGFSHVTDAVERTDANQGMHDILFTQNSFLEGLIPIVNVSVPREFTCDCTKIGIGVLGPKGTPNAPRVFSEGAVMVWTFETQVIKFNEFSKGKRKLTGDFVLCWQNMYHPNSHFDALVRIINTSIGNFLTQHGRIK